MDEELDQALKYSKSTLMKKDSWVISIEKDLKHSNTFEFQEKS